MSQLHIDPSALPESAFEGVAFQPDARLDAARRVLSRYYGYADFRPGQSTLVDALLSGRDALGVMPTGAGKSLCYQIPGIMLAGLAIVVSPLVSLMGDQVRSLIEAGVRGSYLNSTLTPGQQRTVMRRARAGTYKIMYVAPERLADPAFLEFVRSVPVPLVAVDEAHCVSQWGQDFRPSYLGIRQFVESLPVRPVVAAFTATATEKVRRDIVDILGLEDPVLAVTGYDRPNLRFGVERLVPKRKRELLASYALERKDDSGIVYCSTRKDVESLVEWLRTKGISAVGYHAGMPSEDRERNQRAFIDDDAPVMVATNAFGMGIDKSNVRWVVHYNMPKSIEAYYQEAGRAGRDGEPSECLLLWSDGDVSTCRYFIEEGSANEELTEEEAERVRAGQRRLLESMVGYCHTTGCLRNYILDYFGDRASRQGGESGCGNCSNCDGEFDSVDVTDLAKSCVACVKEVDGSFGKTMVVDILRGSRSQRIVGNGLDRLACYGTVDEPASKVKEVIELLAADGVLSVSEGTYPVVGLGPKSPMVEDPGFSFTMKRMVSKPRFASLDVASIGSVVADDPDAPFSTGLFSRLRVLRKRLAEEAGVPPYMVFSDKTLREMCAKRPSDAEGLLSVSGVGETKLARYGGAFLDEIETYAREAGQ